MSESKQLNPMPQQQWDYLAAAALIAAAYLTLPEGLGRAALLSDYVFFGVAVAVALYIFIAKPERSRMTWIGLASTLGVMTYIVWRWWGLL